MGELGWQFETRAASAAGKEEEVWAPGAPDGAAKSGSPVNTRPRGGASRFGSLSA